MAIDFAVTLPALTLAGIVQEGDGAVSAVGAVTLPALIVAAGNYQTGTGAMTLPALGVSGAANTGIQTAPFQAPIALPALTVAASALTGIAASGNITLPALFVGSTGPGAGRVTLPALTVAGTAVSGATARGAVSLPALGVAGAATVQSVVSGAVTLPALRVVANGSSGILARAAVTLPALQVAAVGDVPFVATAAITLPMLTVAGEALSGITASLNATLPALSVSGLAKVGIVGQGLITLPMLTIAADGHVQATATATVVLPMLRVSGAIHNQAAGDIQAYALHMENFALSSYAAFGLNSMAKFNGVYLGATAAGIFALVGDTDNEAAIAAVLRTGITDFGTGHLKRLERVWVEYRATGALNLTVITDGGVRTTYKLQPTGSTGMHGHSQKIGQGLESKYWGFEVSNVAGCDFALDVIEPKPLILKRRHGGGNA